MREHLIVFLTRIIQLPQRVQINREFLRTVDEFKTLSALALIILSQEAAQAWRVLIAGLPL